MNIKRFLLLGFLLPAMLQAQDKSDAWLEQLLQQNASPLLKQVLSQPDTFLYQIIYTKIDRDKNNVPHFTNYYLHVNKDSYFNPASTVKMPLAFLALEKLNEYKIKGLDKHTPMLTDSSFEAQSAVLTDTSAENGLPSIAQYIRKVFLVSDNDAYNRLYEFIGQETINKKLWEKGYPDIRITRRFVRMTEEQNRHTNGTRFMQGDKLVYAQPPAYSTIAFDFSKKNLVGRAYLDRDDKLVNGPMDFTTHNNFPLESQQQILQSVLFPGSVPAKKRFKLTDDDYKFLYQYMSEYPYESRHPAYDTTEYFTSYTKFFMFKAGKTVPPPYIRVFNKTGWSYGFLTDAAYIVDFKNKVEFMLTGTIYVNADGILNDNKYEYEQTGYPFFKEVGNIIYQYELKRERKYPPDLKKFKINYIPKAITRGDTSRKELAIVFTGDEYAEGTETILKTLRKHGVKASFFLTGRFPGAIDKIKKEGHYVGAHSNDHLLYCDWTKRDSLLVTKEQFTSDLLKNYTRLGITKTSSPYFLPPYEWYNDSIVAWTKELGLQLINYTPGTLSHADYTTPSMKNYRSSETILTSIYKQNLNGFILLMHAGAGPERTDKLYDKLDELLTWLKQQNYKPVTVNELLK